MHAKSSEEPVIVVGGGPGGLCAGIALARRGIPVRVLEQADALRTAGAGLTIQINAMRMLASLGLAEAVARAGAPLTCADVTRADGTPLQAMNLAAAAQRFGQPAIAIHREALSEILAAALPPDALVFGANVESVAQDKRAASVSLDDGRTLKGRAIIGADGIHSAVRAAVCGVVAPRYAGYTCWRGIAPVPTGHPEGHSVELWGSGKRFGLVPIGQGRTYWYATVNAPRNGRDGDDPKAELLERYAEFQDAVREVLSATPASAIMRHDIIDLVPLPRWVDGRIALLGDAAHAMTPNMGQGACQAIEDAVVLAACLEGTDDLPAALREYEATRRPRAISFVRRSHQVGKLGQWQGAVAGGVRALLMRATPARTIDRMIAEAYGVDVPAP
jgi:2-polyprenyl-6-methoxyphenol hydroxylase-like FAD-dependent oxidoreductase